MRGWIVLFAALSLGCADIAGLGRKLIAEPRIELSAVRVDDACTAPKWRLDEAKGDTTCGGLFEHCVRVTCRVTALSEGGAFGKVSAWYTSDGGAEIRREQEISIPGDATRELVFDFEEAKIGDQGAKYGCVAETTPCQTVYCDVTNTGDAPGTAKVKGKFTTMKGVHVESESEVNLAVGQTRTVSFDFVGQAEQGVGACDMVPVEEP
jgi:hypothetical protein